MAEDSTDTTTTDKPDAPDTGATDWKAEAEKWQAHARKQEERAKSNANAAKELEKVRAASMTDQEKAVATAKAEALAEANRAAAPRLVRAEFRAAAAGTVDKGTLDAYLEDVDLSKFVNADGEPDSKAIEARIKRLGGGKSTDFDGGARTTTGKTADMNSFLRQRAGMA